MMKIFNDEDLTNACVACRRVINNQANLFNIYFKFNYDGEPICRFCDKPFRSDVGIEENCYALECGHAYHKTCLLHIGSQCMGCGYNILSSKRVFLHFD